MKCKNCKFFASSEYLGSGFHLCERIKHIARGDPCSDLASVEDGSDYFAALRVKEDFGCVYFEEKS